MAETNTTDAMEKWVLDLSLTKTEAERRSFLSERPELFNRESVQQLYDAVVHLAGIDLKRSEKLAEAASWIASGLKDSYAFAQSARAVGHVLYLNGKYKQAIV